MADDGLYSVHFVVDGRGEVHFTEDGVPVDVVDVVAQGLELFRRCGFTPEDELVLGGSLEALAGLFDE